MKLSELYQIFKKKACQIPNFIEGKKEDVKYDIHLLANAYVQAIDEHDEVKEDMYFSALMIRYWHMILYFKNKSPNVEMEEIVSWVSDGIQKAAKYRGWLTDPKLIGNIRSAEKCINQTITSKRAQFYNLSNATKRKQDFLDDYKIFLDSLEDREAESYLGVDDSFYPVDVNIVQSFLKDNKYLEGVVVDLIMNGDSVSKRFSVKKLISELTSLSDDSLKDLNNRYFKYFKDKYDVRDISKVKEVLKTKASKLSRFNVNQIIKRLQSNALIKELHQ